MKVKLLSIIALLCIMLGAVGLTACACEHEKGKIVTVKEATCTEDGLAQELCVKCDVLMRVNVLDATGHDFEYNKCMYCGLELCTDGLDFKLNEDGESYSVKSYNGISSHVIIPSAYNGKPVTDIRYSSFENNTLVKSVDIPESVTCIGHEAFKGCANLTKVNFLGTIDQWVQVDFYDSPTEYTKDLYVKDQLVTQVKLTSATKINDRAFYNCKSITSIEIPSNVTSIGRLAFSNCHSGLYTTEKQLTYVKINGNPYYMVEGVTDEQATTYEINPNTKVIGANAFAVLWSLESISIPASVEIIEYSGFWDCISLKTINFEGDSQLRIIGDSAFNENALESIAIPSTVESIGPWTFGGCNELKTVTFGKNSKLTSIGEEAFYDCNLLESLQLPKTLTSIGEFAFYGCAKLTNLDFLDSSNWYKTENKTEWQNKTGGVLMDLSNEQDTATYFKANGEFFWFKKTN